MTTSSTTGIPTHLDTTTKSYFVSVSRDKLEATYTGQGVHEHDIGFVRSNAPVSNDRAVFYFEVFVKNAGSKETITLGFTSKITRLDKTMNWYSGLFGYRAKDGFRLRDGPKGESYAPSYTTTDTIGAGVDFQRMEIFFTKNGEYLDVAFKDVPGFLYPTIGLHSPGEHVLVNFGSKPFMFDIEKYVSKREREMTREISRSKVSSILLRDLVIEYVKHQGYERTLRAMGYSSSSSDIIDKKNNNEIALSFRASTRSCIMKGECLSVFEMLREHEKFSDLISTRPDVMSRLHTQVFVELVRDSELERAVKYARKYLKDSSVLALLAYKNPESSPLKHFMSTNHRVNTATILNNAILDHHSKGLGTSPLHRILQHAKAALDVHREIRGNHGPKYESTNELLL